MVKPVDPDALLALLASLEWSERTDRSRPLNSADASVELVDR